MPYKNNLDDGTFGKIALFPKKSEINYLVTGKNDEQYYYCSTARERSTICSEEWKKYKKK
jgi:hypothetical protein